MVDPREEKAMRMGKLIVRKLDGELTEAESIELDAWLAVSPENRAVHDEMLDDYSREVALAEVSPRDPDVVEQNIWNRFQPDRSGLSKRWIYGTIVGVAATLLLALAYTKQTTIVNWLNPIETITISTTNGQIKEVSLPDGSSVWLNSSSSLIYPSRFDGGQREVSLSGQAFFQVANDAVSPFSVQVGEVNVLVLGTSFEVTAFQNLKQALVAVQTGSVKVFPESGSRNRSTTLTVKQKAKIDTRTGNIEVSEIPDDDVAGWRENRLSFSDDDFATVIEAFQRRYGVHIDVQKTSLLQEKITLKLEDQPLHTALEILSLSSNFTYRFANDSTIVIR